MSNAKYIASYATISNCGNYRYSLFRVWDKLKPLLVFIMLNPSTADADNDDASIRRTVGFGQRLGYGGVVILNLFAYRSTDPKMLKKVDDPVGPENKTAWQGIIEHIWKETGKADVICAWGVHGTHMAQDLTGLTWLREMYNKGWVRVSCLGTTKDGHPKHPLYLRGDTVPTIYMSDGRNEI